MPQVKHQHELISILIPCYNGADFITDTIRSIHSQTGVNFEIILIDDGSTDNTKSIILSIADPKVAYFYQSNAGVSNARNQAFSKSKGQYVVFFDADDKMEENFLSSRLHVMKANEDLDFVSGEVTKFKGDNHLQGYFRGTSPNAISEILLYDQEVITCPSNFMFRKEFLVKNGIRFNEKLSSTADKYFILLCSGYGKSEVFKGIGKLQYRVNDYSMSHQLTEKLIRDNEFFYEEIMSNKLIPKEIRSQVLFKRDFILFGSYWKINWRKKALRYCINAFFRSPLRFIFVLLKNRLGIV